MKNKHSMERGQALILIVMLAIALVGIVGLAVDGGYAFANRRHAQNTADSAAMAGALAKIQALENGLPMGSASLNACAAALARAASNDMVDTDCGINASGANVNVEVYSPPQSGPYSVCGTAAFNCNDYVQVIISSSSPTYFGRVLGIQDINNTVEAVSLAKGPDVGPLFGGNAIVALDPHSDTCAGEMTVGGSGIVVVSGGGMFVNSDNETCAFVQDGCNVTLDASEGGITSVGGVNLNNNCLGNITGGITTGAEQYPYPPLDIPTEPAECVQAGTISNDKSTGISTITPGWYDKIPPNGATEPTVVMAPGNYCVNNVLKTTVPNEALIGNGVFIYIRTGGTFSLQGGTVNLTAPTSGLYQGYLIYVATNFTGVAPNCIINGNTDDIFVGAIYAPYCDITINGNSALDGLQSQIIGYNVTLSGTSAIYVSYDPNENPTGYRPPQLGLMR